MATIVYRVEFRVDTDSKLYRYCLNESGFDGVRCNGMIERTLNKCLMELVEKRLMYGERKDGE